MIIEPGIILKHASHTAIGDLFLCPRAGAIRGIAISERARPAFLAFDSAEGRLSVSVHRAFDASVVVLSGESHLILSQDVADWSHRAPNELGICIMVTEQAAYFRLMIDRPTYVNAATYIIEEPPEGQRAYCSRWKIVKRQAEEDTTFIEF